MRPTALLRLMGHAEATFRHAPIVSVAAVALADRVFRAAEVPFDASVLGRQLRLPVSVPADGAGELPARAFLDDAVQRAVEGDGPAADLAAALLEMEPDLRWERRAPATTDPAEFFDGHANAVLIGPHGPERRADILVGLTLMAPHVRYPDHRHPPEEFYVVLSPGEWRRDGGAWSEPGVGGVVYHPPGVEHSMRSGAAPLLALWFLWTGGSG